MGSTHLSHYSTYTGVKMAHYIEQLRNCYIIITINLGKLDIFIACLSLRLRRMTT